MKLNKNILLGMIITLSGSLLYVLMSALSKSLSKHLIVQQLVFLQSLSGLICACYLVKKKKYQWQQFRDQHTFAYLARSLMSLTSIYTFFYGLQFMSVFNALVILNLSPLIMPLLRLAFFKKKIHSFTFPSIFLAFTGIVLILSPDHYLLSPAISIIIVSMLCMSFSLLILEHTQGTDPNLSILSYFFYSTLVTSLILLFQPQSIKIPFSSIPSAALIGALFFLVQLSIVYAAKYISSQLISILFYSEVIIALLFSLMFEDLKINISLVFGTILVITGGIGVVLIENRLK